MGKNGGSGNGCVLCFYEIINRHFLQVKNNKFIFKFNPDAGTFSMTSKPHGSDQTGGKGREGGFDSKRRDFVVIHDAFEECCSAPAPLRYSVIKQALPIAGMTQINGKFCLRKGMSYSIGHGEESVRSVFIIRRREQEVG